jgi:purine-nucleoside phosphorylase
VILGSGWGGVSESGELIAEFSYADHEDLFPLTIEGHPGQLRIIKLNRWYLAVFAGRFHCYQGLSAFEASLPVRLASALGCRRLLLTCATGGINETYEPGDFMYVSDHLNLLGDNPLKGLSESPFVDLTHLYNQEFSATLSRYSAGQHINLHTGVLAAMSGPSYETPAEIRMLAMLGADVVSMSMVHEAIMACYLDLEVVGLALVANPAAGLSDEAISHEDVLACGSSASYNSQLLFSKIVELWQADNPPSAHL